MTVDLDSIAAALTDPAFAGEHRFVPIVSDNPNDRGMSGDSPLPATPEDDGLTSIRARPVSGCFWAGLPWISRECSRRWLGERLFFFRDSVPSARRIAIVSSRLHQRMALESWWFDLLRTAVLQCDSQREMLVVANTTATCDAVSRAAALFGRPLIRFRMPNHDFLLTQSDVLGWLTACLEQRKPVRDEESAGRTWDVCVSPELRLSGLPLSDVGQSHLPLGDRLLCVAADRIQVLSCREQGNVSNLMKAHLDDAERRMTPLWIASNSTGELPAVVDDLPSGCIPWLVQPCRMDANPAVAISPKASERIPFAETAARGPEVAPSTPLSHPDDWLLHWTRAPRGPWPGETEADFLDSLILRTEAAERSALATLLRIIADGKLIASTEGIRGRYSVVGFTGVPLNEFRSRRIFRKHRHRFDFEPWGVAILKDQLSRIGVRPVIYGDDADWHRLNPADRPFFQKATFRGATSNVSELEQRSVGDVDLRQFPRDSVCAFVGDSDAARLVSRHSEWPVIVVPGGEE